VFISTIVLSSINKSLRLYKTSGIFYMGTFAVPIFSMLDHI